MNRALVARSLVSRAGFSTSARTAGNKVPQMQKEMQVPDGKLLYLKGGSGDRIFYRTTMGLVIFGVGYSLISLVVAMLPKKNE